MLKRLILTAFTALPDVFDHMTDDTPPFWSVIAARLVLLILPALVFLPIVAIYAAIWT